MVFASLLQYMFVMMLMEYLFAASMLTATIIIALWIYINTFPTQRRSVVILPSPDKRDFR